MQNALQPSLPFYNRVSWWILSARCTQHTHTFLTVCGSQGAIWPIEHFLADDRGHTLLANGVARFEKRPFDATDMALIHLAINSVAVVLLAGVLVWSRMPWAAWFCIVLGSRYGIPGPLAGADAQASFFGEFCLMLVFPLVWVRLADPPVTGRDWFGGSGVGFLAAALTYLLRQAIGLAGLILVVVVHGFLFFQKRESWRLVLRKTAVLGILITVVWKSPGLVLGLRNHLFALPPGERLMSHGLLHTLYLGLGTEPNPWGIDYNNDASGQLAVRKMNPAIRFETKEYYQALGRLYGTIVRHYPMEVFRIYARKFIQVVRMPLRIGGLPIFWYWIFGMGLALWRIFWSPSPSRSWLYMLTIGTGVGLFCIQGVLAKPSPEFLYPAKFGVLLMMSCIVA